MALIQPNRDDLAVVIRQLRADRGLTIDQLAHRCGMHATYLSRIERGRNNPTWERLCDIAHALGLLPSDIVLEAEAEARSRKRRR